MVKLNKKKLKQKGLNFKNKSELFEFVKHKIEWLSAHNKNYTTEQYYLIDMLKEIFDCFEITEN